jgi:hypothetical protein
VTYLAITTCNGEQWAKYGRTMAKTFARYWPAEIPLRVYREKFEPDTHWLIEFADLDEAAPWLAPWKAACGSQERGITPQGYRYRWDAVRFAHKVAAIGAAADTWTGEGVLIWMDADIVTHARVETRWLTALFPPTADLAWLDRDRRYPECGFMMFRLPEARQVIADIVQMYRDGRIFDLEQWHDSYVIETVVKAAEALGQIAVASLSGAARERHHPFCAGPLGAAMDHLKGKRKEIGRSLREDLMGPRPEPYWKS